MNPWQDSNYPTLDYRDHKFYNVFADPSVEYKHSPIVFAGSCDIGGNRQSRYWHEIYSEKFSIKDAIKIGRPSQSFSGMNRVLYTYLSNVEEKPNKILMVVPMTSAEHVINGVCYSVNYMKMAVDHLERLGIIPSNDFQLFKRLSASYYTSNTLEERLFNFGKEFSFLEMMCKCYSIDLQWTFNLTLSAEAHYNNKDLFAKSHPFAAKTYIGTKECKVYDTTYYSPSAPAHEILAQLFIGNTHDL